jgi:predicted small secreted protein
MMKRITSILLALLLTSTVLASCGKNNNEGKETTAESNAVETTAPETDAPEAAAPADAKATLEALYPSFLDKLAPAFGAGSGEEIAGYFAGPEVETITETDPDTGEEYSYDMPKSGPGAIDLSNPENLYNTLLPAEHADKLNSAAVFFNMMNMNNGTFSAFSLKNPADAQAVCDILKTAITGNMWMCGFPERYLIVNIDGLIISAFGVGDGTNALKDVITETYANAVVVYDEAL